jgi:ABC-2 type transport system permease protein
MSSVTNIFLIARREYLERVRAKSFLVMTVLIPVLMGGAIFATAIMNRNLGSGQHIAVVTTDSQFAADLKIELVGSSRGSNPVVDVYAPTDPGVFEKLDTELKTKANAVGGVLDGYLVVQPSADPGGRPAFDWHPRVQADVVTRSGVAAAAGAALTREKLTASGMSAEQINALMKPVDLNSGEGKSDHSNAALASAYGMYLLMYFVILFYGMNVARSIIEEKTSRVFEVLLATIKPEEMLGGKVIGVGAVGLTQVGIWIVVAVAALKFQLIGQDVHVLPSAPQAALFVIFFLLGYLLYSSLAAALGAMNNSEQELQQMQIFLMLPLIFTTLIIFTVVNRPDGIIARVASFVPFTSPLIMYTRVIVGKPSILAVSLSILALIITIAIILWLASRIYRVGILMYGKKPNLPEILRWLKYS